MSASGVATRASGLIREALVTDPCESAIRFEARQGRDQTSGVQLETATRERGPVRSCGTTSRSSASAGIRASAGP